MKLMRRPVSGSVRLVLHGRAGSRSLWSLAIALAVVVIAAAFKIRAAGAAHVAPLVGTWENDDAATREQTRAVIGVAHSTRVLPALRNKTLTEARRAAASAHCRLALVRRAYSGRVRRGRVVAQSPAPGRKLRNGAPVSVVISRGPRR